MKIYINKLIFLINRWKAGVPASLNYVLISDDKSPILFPYPSWEANALPDDAISETVMESTGKQQNNIFIHSFSLQIILNLLFLYYILIFINIIK